MVGNRLKLSCQGNLKQTLTLTLSNDRSPRPKWDGDSCRRADLRPAKVKHAD
jgi:hypothetical protein